MAARPSSLLTLPSRPHSSPMRRSAASRYRSRFAVSVRLQWAGHHQACGWKLLSVCVCIRFQGPNGPSSLVVLLIERSLCAVTCAGPVVGRLRGAGGSFASWIVAPGRGGPSPASGARQQQRHTGGCGAGWVCDGLPSPTAVSTAAGQALGHGTVATRAAALQPHTGDAPSPNHDVLWAML